jgi:hypothetical protein
VCYCVGPIHYTYLRSEPADGRRLAARQGLKREFSGRWVHSCRVESASWRIPASLWQPEWRTPAPPPAWSCGSAGHRSAWTWPGPSGPWRSTSAAWSPRCRCRGCSGRQSLLPRHMLLFARLPYPRLMAAPRRPEMAEGPARGEARPPQGPPPDYTEAAPPPIGPRAGATEPPGAGPVTVRPRQPPSNSAGPCKPLSAGLTQPPMSGRQVWPSWSHRRPTALRRACPPTSRRSS